MLAKSQTELENFEQEIRNGEHKNSSPRYVGARVESAIKADVGAALSVGLIETTTDFMAVHYTSLDAVIAMLKAVRDGEGYLRMYSANGFNDPNEGKLFTSVAKEKSQSLAPCLPEDQDADRNPAFVASFIRVEQSNGEQSQTVDPANDLLFWRIYGREGTGCSLQLSLSAASEEIREVTYGEIATASSIASIDNALAAVFHVAERVVNIATDDGLLKGNAPDSSNIISHQIQAELKKVRYLYKALTYRFEKECRLVETPESSAEKGIRAEFDYSGTQGTAVVKKYIDHPSLKLTADMLDSDSHITLGPLVPNPMHTKEYIKRLLQEASFYGPRVRISKIPYRAPFHH